MRDYDAYVDDILAKAGFSGLPDDVKKVLVEMALGAHDEGYSAGVEDTSDGVMPALKQGLDIIDTDRTAAKIYLDRATRALGKHLIEVSPCLL